jgi:hypothetical protein
MILRATWILEKELATEWSKKTVFSLTPVLAWVSPIVETFHIVQQRAPRIKKTGMAIKT